MTRVDILHFAGCPNVEPTADRVCAVAARLGLQIELRLVPIASTEEAVRERFLGSPTVRVNGADIDPASWNRSDFGLSCRVYGGAGLPPEEMIEAALRKVTPGGSGFGPRLAAGGSVIAAAVSSACCWLPLLALASGASAGGAALAFAPLRPWLIGFAVASLALGVWMNERGRRARDACGCAPLPRRRRRANRLMLGISAAGVVAFTLFPLYTDAVFGDRPPIDPSDARREITLRVDGMTCTGCETGIEAALRRLLGVALVEASYADGTVSVSMIPGSAVEVDALIENIARAGFAARVMETAPADSLGASTMTLRVLTDDMRPLVASFNAASSRMRFLAILSPT